MSTEITAETGNVWDGRKLALGSTYGKVMMWFFPTVGCLYIFSLPDSLWVLQILVYHLA